MPAAKRTGPASWKASKRVKTTRQLNKRAYTASRISRVEVKAVANWIDAVAPLTGATYSVGKVDLGDAYNQRNGRAVRHTTADLYFMLKKPAGDPAITFRIIYGIWKQSFDTRTPSASTILDLNLFTGAEWMAPYNPLYSTNMVILMDELRSVNTGYNTSGSAAGSPGETQQAFVKKVPYASIQEYSGDDGDDVKNWNHFILLISNSSNGLCAIGTQHYFTDA